MRSLNTTEQKITSNWNSYPTPSKPAPSKTTDPKSKISTTDWPKNPQLEFRKMSRKLTFSPASESATMRAWSQRVVDLVRRLSSSAPPINTRVLSTTLLHPLEPELESESEPETEPVHMVSLYSIQPLWLSINHSTFSGKKVVKGDYDFWFWC